MSGCEDMLTMGCVPHGVRMGGDAFGTTSECVYEGLWTRGFEQEHVYLLCTLQFCAMVAVSPYG